MSIIIHEEKKLFLISTEHTSYGMEVTPDGVLAHLYWGPKLERIEDILLCERVRHDPRAEYDEHALVKQEYPGAGGYFFDEPCLRIDYRNSCRDTKLFYRSAHTERANGSETLVIDLCEELFPLTVRLFYRVYDGLNVLERWAEIHNDGTSAVQLESAQSAVYYLPRSRSYRLTHMSGKWSAEYQLERVNLTKNRTVIDTRRGISGHDSCPWFAVDEEGQATEFSGDVWAGTIHWSGNWKITAEVDHDEQTRITCGINDYDFGWNLKPGSAFTTPTVTTVFSREGFGGASRCFHEYQRERLMPQNKSRLLRPVMYNSWGVFEFDIDEQQQMRLADRAAALGVELFVMDDGWFGARDGEHAGLGDWYPSPKKFPNGLDPLIRHVTGLGMKFGIWVEPEMVNEDSDLYRKHPDWILRAPGKKITECRYQYVLNFAREDVCDFAWNFLEDLLQNHEIGYLKWDMNRYLCEVSWPEVPEDEQREVWTRYVYNVHKLFRRIQERFPEVLLEDCASGGGRVDLGMLQNSDLVAPSDCGDPLDKLKIYEGYTQVFLPKSAGTWFGDNPDNPRARHTPDAFRIHEAMLGSCSLGMNLLLKSEEELQKLADVVALYKELRPIIQNGNQYRLASIYGDVMSAYEYASADKREAVVFTFGKNMQFYKPLPRIRLMGLERALLYRVNGGKPVSGAALMAIGIEPDLRGDYDSKLYRILPAE